MYDVSCLYDTPELSTIQYDAFDDWNAYWSSDPFEPGFSQLLEDHYDITVDGKYYFVEQNGSLVPVWDLRSTGPYAGNPDAIVYAQKVKSVPSPDGPENVDWVELKKLSGGLANVIYRVDTVQGQPPSSTVSFSPELCLSFSQSTFFSAPLAAMQASSILRITVRVCIHEAMIVEWPLLTCVISSVCLKAVGAELPCANVTCTINIFDFHYYARGLIKLFFPIPSISKIVSSHGLIYLLFYPFTVEFVGL